QPNRAYAEVSRTAHELQKIGPQLVNLQIKNDVAILYSLDSANALDFMPFALAGARQWQMGSVEADYKTVVDQLHRALYNNNVGTDFVFPEDPDFSRYKLIVIPPLYIADDALLNKIAAYVHGGGHVLMAFKSGFANENSAVRAELAPGPLREATGISYQEFSNLEKPLTLKGDPFHAGDNNKVMYWAEFLKLDHAKALATYDHPFFGRWPAITRNQYGSGSLTYEGTFLSDALQQSVVRDALRDAQIATPSLPEHVIEKSGVNAQGKTLHYILNYSSTAHTFTYSQRAATDLLTGRSIAPSQSIDLAPWDLVILEEN
ncbi:MAG: beta-galactosidase trimerization domain-containing protein, partial [Acidobacteriota bacterium]|nr:beta-galactosidase trimerization domain-containing protein [Acidobacteriota bacterium]